MNAELIYFVVNFSPLEVEVLLEDLFKHDEDSSFHRYSVASLVVSMLNSPVPSPVPRIQNP